MHTLIPSAPSPAVQSCSRRRSELKLFFVLFLNVNGVRLRKGSKLLELSEFNVEDGKQCVCSAAAAESEWWAGALHAATGAETSSHSDTSHSRGAVQVHEEALGLFPSQYRCVTSPIKLVFSSLCYIPVVIVFWNIFICACFLLFVLIIVPKQTTGS